MNPATFLRVLGPEPWSVCYPEPSIRPDDSRYGDNPNRVQRHTQFQVRSLHGAGAGGGSRELPASSGRPLCRGRGLSLPLRVGRTSFWLL